VNAASPFSSYLKRASEVPPKVALFGSARRKLARSGTTFKDLTSTVPPWAVLTTRVSMVADRSF
jgi:hypothetical protein